MPKFISGRYKKTPQTGLTSDRYRYLSPGDAEPDLGDPIIGPSAYDPNLVPAGNQFIIVNVEGYPGERYWIPNQGGIIPGSISVFEETTLVGGLSSTTQLNFEGSAITAIGDGTGGSNPGVAVTITVAPPGNNNSVLFKNNNDFAADTRFTFNDGLFAAGDRITVGTGGTVITSLDNGLVGIGTTNPTQRLHLNDGNFRISGTIYDSLNQPGNTGYILVKGANGGLVWVSPDTTQSGAGGTIGQIQFHNSGGLVDGADNFYYDFNNNRVGIGSTIPSQLLDVLGISTFRGDVFIQNLTVTGDSEFKTIDVDRLSDLQDVRVSGVSTFNGNIDANGNLDVDGVTDLDDLNVSGFIESTKLNNNVLGNVNSGAAQFDGGVGIAKNLTVGRGIQSVDLNITGVGTIANFDFGTGFFDNIIVTGVSTLGNVVVEGGVVKTKPGTGNLTIDTDGSSSVVINDGVLINKTTNSTSKDDGALVVDGGVGIEKDVFIGDKLNVIGKSTLTGIVTTGTDLYVGGDLYVNDDIVFDNLSANTGTFTDSLDVQGITTTEILKVGTNPIVSISAILDEDDMSSNSDTALATQQSIKTYVDNQITSQDLDFTGDSGSGSIDLDTQSFAINGTANEIETLALNQQLTIGLPNNVTIANNLTVNGNTTLGNADTDNLVFNAKIDSNIIPTSNKDLGSVNDRWNNVYADNIFGSLSGISTGSDRIRVAERDTNADHYVTFISRDPDSNYEELFADDELKYNASLNRLNVGILSASSNSTHVFGSGNTQIRLFPGGGSGTDAMFHIKTSNGDHDGILLDMDDDQGSNNFYALNIRLSDSPQTHTDNTNTKFLVNAEGNLLINRGATLDTNYWLDVNGAARFAANVDIGESSSDTLTITSRVDSNIIPSADSTYNLGAANLFWSNVYADNFVGTVTGVSTGSNSVAVFEDDTAGQRYLTFIKNDPDSNFEEVFADDQLKYDASSNVLTVKNISIEQDLFVSGITSTTRLEVGPNITTVGITSIVDEDDMISDSVTALATQQSIKAYVDNQITSQDLDFSGDTGSGSIDLDSEIFAIIGTTNEIETSVPNNETLRIGLPDDVVITNTLTVNGDTTLGSDNGDDLTINSEIVSSLIPKTNNNINIGSSLKKWNTVFATTFNGQFIGNAETATALANAQNFSIDGTGGTNNIGEINASEVLFDGTSPVVLDGNLKAITGFNPGNSTIGDSTNIPTFKVNNQGLIYEVGTVGVNFSTATVAQSDKVKVSQDDTTGVRYLSFIKNDADGSYEDVFADDQLQYNSSTNTLALQETGFRAELDPKYVVIGKGNGSVALTINDSEGDANITFNHQNGIPDINGNSGRIRVNVDSTSSAEMGFELKENVVSGADEELTRIFTAKPASVTPGSNNTIDLGSGSLKWKDVYATTFNGAFQGTADNADQLKIEQGTTDTNHYITFVSTNPNDSYQTVYGDSDLSYNPDDNTVRMVRYKGNPYDCVPAYSSTDYNSIVWDTNESAIKLQTSGSDVTIGMAFPAFRVDVNTGQTFKLSLQIRSDTSSTNGVYIRVYEYDSELPDGKTHVSNNATNPVVQEDTRQKGLSPTYENQPGNTSWQTINFDYTPTTTAVWASVVVLNWTGLGTNALYVRDLKRESVIGQVTSALATDLAGGTAGDLLYQDGLDSTAFLADPGSSGDGYLLKWDNANVKPAWVNPTSLPGIGYDLKAVQTDGTNTDPVIRLTDGVSNDDVQITGGSNITVSRNSDSQITVSALTGAGLGVDTSVDDVLKVETGNIAAIDPNDDRIVFYDNSGEKLTYLDIGTGLSISGTTISATSDAGKTYTLPLTTNNGGSGVGDATWTLTDDSGNTDPVTLSAGANITINGSGSNFTVAAVAGAGLGVDASVDDVLGVSGGSINAVDPNDDRIVFYDNSGERLRYLDIGTGLSIDGTTLNAQEQSDTTYQLKVRRESDGGNAGNDTNPYLFLDASSGTDDSVRLVGSGGVTVSRNNDGQLTINGTNAGSGQFFTGMIIMFSGTSIPTGWALCNGANGTPDLRGRFIVGAQSASKTGTTDQPGPGFNSSNGAIASTYEPGDIGGSTAHQLTEAQLASHDHPIGNHSHNVGSHTHNIGEHSHNIGNHSHNVGSHTHYIGGHTHSVGGNTGNQSNSHSHDYARPNIDDGGDSGSPVGSGGQIGSNFTNNANTGNQNQNHSHSMDGTANAVSGANNNVTTGTTTNTGSNTGNPNDTNSNTGIPNAPNSGNQLTGNTTNTGSNTGNPNTPDSSNTGDAGSNLYHENRPPYYALCYIMKT